MQRSMQVSAALLAAAASLAMLSCSADQPTRTALGGGSDLLLAHSPVHHGIAEQEIALASVPSYAQLEEAAAEGVRGALQLAVTAAGTIPRFPDEFIRSVAVFGYAWVDTGTGQGLVATIHPVIGRDSRQNPDGWHTHPVQLSGPSSFDFCIASLGTSQAGISIQDDRMRVNIAQRQARLAAGALDVAAAFVVRPDPACASGLGVEVLSAQPLS